MRSILFLTLFVVSLAAKSAPSLSQIEAMSKSTLPIISQITDGYQFSTLQKYMAPDMLEGNEGIYREMLRKASVLGKLKDCDHFQFGSSTEIEGLFVVGATSCPFENGEGRIKVLLMPEGKGYSVVQFIIKPYK